MKENVKNTTKTLYTMCICLVIVMGVLFLGNSLTKGTYSVAVTPELNTPLATDTEYCPNGATPSNGKCGCATGYTLQTPGHCCPSGFESILPNKCYSNYNTATDAGGYYCSQVMSTGEERCKNSLKGTYDSATATCTWKCKADYQDQIASKTCAAGMYLINNKCVTSDTNEKTFTANFTPNGGSGSIVSRACTTTTSTSCTVVAPAAPTRSGYNFKVVLLLKQ